LGKNQFGRNSLALGLQARLLKNDYGRENIVLNIFIFFRYFLIEYRNIKDSVTRMVERGNGWDEPDSTDTDSSGESYFRQMDSLQNEATKKLEERCFPALEILLKEFVYRPGKIFLQA